MRDYARFILPAGEGERRGSWFWFIAEKHCRAVRPRGSRQSMNHAVTRFLPGFVRRRLESRADLQILGNIGWQLADNLRLGLVYAVVLEAFKLGT